MNRNRYSEDKTGIVATCFQEAVDWHPLMVFGLCIVVSSFAADLLLAVEQDSVFVTFEAGLKTRLDSHVHHCQGVLSVERE